ncbi:MAG: hypothetical protein AAF696_12465 [Bacteroidota bacterium]
MVQTQLIQLLSKLTVGEIRLFDKYIHSPYFSTHNDTIRFFEILLPHYPDFPAEAIEKEKVFEALFPGQDYKDEILRTLRKYLLKQLSYFLAMQRFREDELMVQNHMLEALAEKEVHTHFKKQVRHAENLIKKYPDKDEKFFLKQFWIERALLEYQYTYEQRENPSNLDRAHKLLDHYYLSAKLELMVSQLNTQVVVEIENKEFLFSQEVIELLDREHENYPPLIRAYYYLVKILQDPEENAAFFQNAKDLLFSEVHQFSQKDAVHFFIPLISFANQKYRAGDRAYLNEMYQLYKFMLEKDLLFEGKTFPVHNFKNLVTLGLRIGEYDWTEQFIHEYKQYISDDYKDGIVKYNLAHLYFYQGRYGESLTLMQGIEMLDTFYQMSYKMLQLKIYYEQEEVDSFFSLAKTFQTYIRRQSSIPASRKEAYYNFVSLLRKLFRIKIREKNNLLETQAEIQETQPLIEQGYLKQKVSEFSLA